MIDPEIMGRLKWVRTILQDTIAYAQRTMGNQDVTSGELLAIFAAEAADVTLNLAGVEDWHGEEGLTDCGEYRWKGGCEWMWRRGQK